MQQRTFVEPDVRFDSEIEFCAPSWKRKRKYVSWKHWLKTKAAGGRSNKIDKTVCYKLFEMGHYAGAVILEIGLKEVPSSFVSVSAAKDAGFDVKYFGVDSDSAAIQTVQKSFRKKRLGSKAVFFRGSLTEFRNAIPVSPTMVIVNERENMEAVLAHLALFIQSGTPVLVKNWYQSREEIRSMPQDSSFEFCGRFGEMLLLKAAATYSEDLEAITADEFCQLRSRFEFDENGVVPRFSNQKNSRPLLANRSNVRSEKKWPFVKSKKKYPATLPDGTSWPKISVVTPTRNQGKYIEETVASVLNQNYPNLEYIVVDGASTDDTPEVLHRYASSIEHLITEPDEGQSDAINKGMALATGDVLTWLNSDDMLTPGTLYAMAMAFWKSKADMVVGTVQFLKDGEISGEHLTSCENGPLQLSELLDLDDNWLEGRFFYQPELMFTRDLWERAGGCVDKELFYSMDYELWLRFAISGANVHVIGRPTVLYRVHDEQKTHGDYEPELRKVNRRYIEKHGVPVKSVVKKLQPINYRATFVNDVGPRYGAGIAHGRLRDSLEAAGHATKFVCARPDDDSPSKNDDELYADIEQSNPDIVVFGNLHNSGVGMQLVDRVSERWPTSFVMHDLWLATGRCYYHGGCEKFQSNCDSQCPTASEYPALNPEEIESAFEGKLNVISKPRKVVVMPNSPWTKTVAEQSAIVNKGVLKTMKYGFPTEVFKPRDKSVCRELLGLPSDAFIVLFAAVNVDDDRKGVRHLIEALNRLQLDNLQPVCIGIAGDTSSLFPGTISLGYVDDPWRNALIYSAADVFVGPSLQEAFGQVFIEAAACGTPSIGYPVGGVQNAIEHGVTGRVASIVHPSALASEIERLYSDESYRNDLAAWGRIEVENEWSYRSAYHHFNNVLRQVPEHLGFVPPAKIQFDPTRVSGATSSLGESFGLLHQSKTEVRMSSGFTEAEQITFPDGAVDSIQWAVGNTCEINLRVVGDDAPAISARCLNPSPGQQVSIVCNGEFVQTISVPFQDDFFVPVEFLLLDDLAAGEYQIRLDFSRTIRETGGSRELAIAFLDLAITDEPQKPGNEIQAPITLQIAKYVA